MVSGPVIVVEPELGIEAGMEVDIILLSIKDIAMPCADFYSKVV
jgi:hypothetical protein